MAWRMGLARLVAENVGREGLAGGCSTVVRKMHCCAMRKRWGARGCDCTAMGRAGKRWERRPRGLLYDFLYSWKDMCGPPGEVNFSLLCSVGRGRRGAVNRDFTAQLAQQGLAGLIAQLSKPRLPRTTVLVVYTISYMHYCSAHYTTTLHSSVIIFTTDLGAISMGRNAVDVYCCAMAGLLCSVGTAEQWDRSAIPHCCAVTPSLLNSVLLSNRSSSKGREAPQQVFVFNVKRWV